VLVAPVILGTFVPSILIWVTCLLSLHLTHSAYAFALVRDDAYVPVMMGLMEKCRSVIKRHPGSSGPLCAGFMVAAAMALSIKSWPYIKGLSS
jgi:hypothetical protein